MEVAAVAAPGGGGGGGGGGLVEQRRDHVKKDIGYAHKVMMKKKKKKMMMMIRRIERHGGLLSHYNNVNNKAPMALQQLFLSCRDVFRGPGTVPSPRDVQKLCTILDDMKPEDVGLSSKLQLFSAKDTIKGTPIVTSTTIYKCKNFSLCLFFLPPTAVIPLHNHPGMTVFSKLLLGTMHIKSYDWVDPVDLNDSAPPAQSRLAKLIRDGDFTAPCKTSVLYPTTGGNIHEFTGITTCAVLDVLGPPYSKDDGRDCSYYKEELPRVAAPPPAPEISPIVNDAADGEGNSEDGECCCRWLEEIEVPDNSHMDEIDYLGPQIINTSY